MLGWTYFHRTRRIDDSFWPDGLKGSITASIWILEFSLSRTMALKKKNENKVCRSKAMITLWIMNWKCIHLYHTKIIMLGMKKQMWKSNSWTLHWIWFQNNLLFLRRYNMTILHLFIIHYYRFTSHYNNFINFSYRK